MVNKTCANCNNQARNNYCDICGQATSTQRLNVHYIVHELQHSLFHVDKGILFTIKELFLHPGNTIKNYWEGKRVSYFKPFAFLIILATIYGFVGHFLQVFPEESFQGVMQTEMEPQTKNEINALTSQVNTWVYGHYALVMLAIMPTMALSSFIVFRKRGYNYIEHLVSATYITGQQLVILLLLYPIYYFVPRAEILAIQYLIVGLYTMYVYYQLFKTEKKWRSCFSVVACYLLSHLISFITLTVLGTIIVLVVQYFQH